MGYIREPKKTGQRWQAEVRLKGHPTLTATFDRKIAGICTSGQKPSRFFS